MSFIKENCGADKSKINFLKKDITRAYLKVSVFGIRNKHKKYYKKLRLSDIDLTKV